jgi:spore maturation protein CgeB
MRIGVIGPTGPDSFAANIIDALSEMGHEPVPLGPSFATGGGYRARVRNAIRDALPAFDERAQLRIARTALDHRCEVVISVEQRLMPSMVGQLRRNGSKVALWFPDHLSSMGRQLMLLAPYDAIFVKEPHLVDRLRPLLDLPLFYLPEACNPRWHRPLVAAGSKRHLVIAGNMYPSRIRLLERLHDKGIPLRLYGSPFPRWVGNTPLRELHAGRPVFTTEKADIFRSAAAVINTLYPAEINGVNARLFEATGSGAAVLTEFRPAVPQLFSVDAEVLAYRNFAELISAAERLLSEEGLSARIGDAAARRAHADHTYEKRLSVILEKVC